MAKIVIAELDINVQAMLASVSSVKKTIDELKKSQKELTDSGDTSSKAFVENASNLKVLNAEYTAGVKALADNTKATADQANRTQLLAIALGQEVSTITEARESNKLLNKLRNDAVTSLGEQSQEVKDLNAKLDENNEFIKANGDAYLKQKINIGNYSESIQDALQNLNPFNGGIAGFTQRAQEAGGAGNLLKTSLGGVVTGIMGVVRASLAFIATPIGAIITLVAGAALILYNVFAKLDPIMDKIEQATAGISGAFTKAQQIVVSFVSNIKSLGDAFSKIANFITNPIDSLKSFGSELGKAATKAAELKAAEQDLGDLKDIYDARNKGLESQINLDKIRLKSKNLTGQQEMEIENRINSNYEKLSANKVEVNSKTLDNVLNYAIQNQTGLKKISNETLQNEIKNGELKYANFLMNEGRITVEAYNKLKESVNAVSDTNNQLAESRERTQDKIQKAQEKADANAEKARADSKAASEKAQVAADALIDKAIEKSKSELDFFIESEGIKAKSLEEGLRIEESIRDKRLAILKTELEKGRITQSEYNLQALTAKNDFLQKQAEVTASNAQQELKNFIDGNKSKLDANKFLNDQMVLDEISRLGSIGEAQKVAEASKKQSKQEYDNAILAIEAETKAKQDEIINTKTIADLEKQAIDQENKIAAVENEFVQKQLDLDRAQKQELDSSEKTGADRKIIENKYAVFQKQLDIEVQTAKLQGISSTLASAASLFKENTLIYKALSIAQISIDTILAAQGAYKAMIGIPVVGPTLAPIAAGIAYASGALNVAKVSGIKFEKGGIQEVGGNRHAQGGTKFYGEDGTTFEAERGEGIGVLNRGAFSAFMDFNNANGSGKSTPTFMAGGGIITQGVQSQNNGLDVNAIIEIVSSMPPPVVAVTDIHRESDNYVRIVNDANY